MWFDGVYIFRKWLVVKLSVPEQFNQNFTKCQGSNKENRQREIGKLAKKKDLVNQTKPKIWREQMMSLEQATD